jgi:hypothetical protein
MWDSFKELLADTFLIFCGGWIAFHLIIIALYGSVSITERFPWILYPEIIIILGLISLGIERLVDDIKMILKGKECESNS